MIKLLQATAVAKRRKNIVFVHNTNTFGGLEIVRLQILGNLDTARFRPAVRNTRHAKSRRTHGYIRSEVRPSNWSYTTTMALVSVIIPTYNRASRLKQVLAALEQQQYPQDLFNVVVISDGSTDGTDDYMRHLVSPLAITFVPQTNSGPANARNNGIAHADSDYVLFIDDDVIPTPTLIAEHMRLHAEQQNLVVLGPMLSPNDFRLSPWVAWEQSMLEKQYRAMNQGIWIATARQFYTGNTSLKRSFLITAGGFNERFRRAEDIELGYRLDELSVKFVFNPQAIGYHYAERSFRSWMEIPYAYGRNDIIFSRERYSWIIDTIRREFKERNRLTRMIVKISLRRPAIRKILIAFFTQLATACYRLRISRISQVSFSAIFNMRYYQGVSDELGGQLAFFTNIHPEIKHTSASL
jgi:glycosyltransferase involved in cell wall biosynthesis